MKFILFALAFFASFKLKAQCITTTKPVKGTPLTTYKKDSMDWYWNVAGLPGISTSGFPIEIRLYAHGLLDGDCYQLCCDGHRVVAQVSAWDTGYRTIMRPVPAAANLKAVFDSLLKNRIFELPDEKEVKFEKSARDGVHYLLEYKVGNIWRRYKFSNPGVYHDRYPDNAVITCYNNIAALLGSLYNIK